jgi:hypothetical protein
VKCASAWSRAGVAREISPPHANQRCHGRRAIRPRTPEDLRALEAGKEAVETAAPVPPDPCVPSARSTRASNSFYRVGGGARSQRRHLLVAHLDELRVVPSPVRGAHDAGDAISWVAEDPLHPHFESRFTRKSSTVSLMRSSSLEIFVERGTPRPLPLPARGRRPRRTRRCSDMLGIRNPAPVFRGEIGAPAYASPSRESCQAIGSGWGGRSQWSR